MPLVVIDGPTIAAGEALSDAVDCTGDQLVRITMPADWTIAPLTVQLSTDGQFFNDVFHADGRELQLTVTAGAAIIVPADVSMAIAFIKLRSGTREHPVPQPAERKFALAVAKGQTGTSEPPP